MAPTRKTPTPALPDEILEEIFLRLPPDEPACLVRASLAGKLWLSLLTSHSFCGRYREFHGAPPMLGFLYSLPMYQRSEPLFVPTTKSGVQILAGKEFDVLDCRHGRVLLGDNGEAPMALLVCDPMTGSRRELYTPKDCRHYGHVAAVLCAVTGCDHRACCEGPSRVVFVSLDTNMSDDACVAHARVSLVQMGGWSKQQGSHLPEWSEPCSHIHLADDAFINLMPPVLVEDALYLKLSYEDDDHVGILKYDLGSECLSLVDVPIAEPDVAPNVILISMENGSLGFAHVDGLTLNLWSRQVVGSDGVAAWTQRIVINLKNLLPIHNFKQTLGLIGSVEGRDIIFLNTDLGIYEINLKSLEWKKIWKSEKCCALFPYMKFYSRTEHANKNGIEMPECAVARSYGVSLGKLVPGRLRSYYWGTKYSRRQLRAPKMSRRQAARRNKRKSVILG